MRMQNCLIDSRHRRGRYSLSARTILELESYLKTEFPDEITHCIGCREVRGALSRPLDCHHAYRMMSFSF